MNGGSGGVELSEEGRGREWSGEREGCEEEEGEGRELFQWEAQHVLSLYPSAR